MTIDKKAKPIRVVVTCTETTIEVTFSDWIKLTPRKLDRIKDAMHKAWRRERAKVVHADRVEKAKLERERGQSETTSENTAEE